ncbi:naringenin,2-oxoglutarate 3-dioxygenase, putative [Phytophthora infestans T30-4]|uniref:Naringenin,2-oxoglutarate 3-dioxygenase, putative n=1 Tax=Phytophthora infestans (strain T30-4) TaxID=403677 RepID=D0MRW1_PHYIT|nr:naringenin,2-oxoglutarate 3-dioxygenase, putative [Phytophthora infestans T30-4]EEY58230.1 naringenin,2-oxoglutarate 3-dioxygenase, putative [Phytophthora infestans T30-4]|eukprot:XP_002909416.1 naringenin,2-oxoglutarate 3-dioxygenase, putative [Phytophthora infestans T30-4]
MGPTDAEVDAALKHEKLGQIVDDVRRAASEWGFFYIANHGLPQQEVDEFQDSMRSFFRLPEETKRTILRTASNTRGYVVDGLTKNKTDWKECFDFAGAHEDGPPTDKVERLFEDQNQWLDEESLPGFRHEMQTYYKKMEYVARRLLKVFAIALGAFFDKFYQGNHSSLLRLNHYPVAPEPEKTMGVYHHTDFGALTILLQDDEVASLQVLHRISQTWVDVPPRKGADTINIGDMVQVWSNDKFVAPLHRVVASDKAGRFSAPFFYNPSNHVTVEPIVVQEGEVANYRPFNWRQYQLNRYQGNYADVGKENQIGDFKIHGLPMLNATQE